MPTNTHNGAQAPQTFRVQLPEYLHPLLTSLPLESFRPRGRLPVPFPGVHSRERRNDMAHERAIVHRGGPGTV